MNTEDFYNRYWQSDIHRVSEWSYARTAKVLGSVMGLGRVLDYGCGMGDGYQRDLADSVRNYCGADVSYRALNCARERGFEVFAIDPVTSRIDAPDSSFDGIVCVEVLEHLFDPLQAVRELYRLLKPGGVLIATVPNFGYHENRFLSFLRAEVPSEPERPKENRYNGVHIRFFGKRTFKRLLCDANLTEVKIGSFDDGSVWDIFRVGGPLGAISDFARQKLPGIFHLRFLQDICPNVFAKRLRGYGRKPA